MSTPPPTPDNAPHLSLAARRLLAHTRRQDAPQPTPLPLPRRAGHSWAAWLVVALPSLLLLAVALWLGIAFVSARVAVELEPVELSAVALLPPSTVTPPAEATITPTPTTTATAVPQTTPPPLVEPPIDSASAAPTLPAVVLPTPISDEIRPGPWPATPAEGAPTRIWSPRIGLDAPIVPVGFEVQTIDGYSVRIYEVARYAAGWHTNSSLPGYLGNTVMAGHQNIDGAVFRPLLFAEEGDFLFVDVGEQTYPYLLIYKEIVEDRTPEQKRANGNWINPTDDERLTLITCWPPNGNTHRVVIVAIPIK